MRARPSAWCPRFGDKVVRNPATWRPSDFDYWGAGVGSAIVLGGPFRTDDGLDYVDVRWPAGRCFQRVDELLPEPVKGGTADGLAR